MTTEERHAKQQERPQLDIINPNIAVCCKDSANLILAEYRPDVVARWECKVCGRRHFRAFMPLGLLNVPIG